jgi:hypothetical protein
MSSVTQTDDTAAKTSPMLWALGLVLLLGGWLSILHVYYWHFTAPVFFLWAGWAALLASARFLFRAGVAAAEDTGDVDDDFWKPVGRREELLLEKRSLLKAIKEIEFDREMGKMSESDAADLTRFYRQRAIEIIKALESEGGAGDTLSVQEQIEREVKARLVVAGTGAKGKARAARGEATDEKPDGQKNDQKNDQKNHKKGGRKADQKAGPKADQKGGPKAERAAETAAEKPAERPAAVSQQPDTAAGEPAASEQAEPEVRAAAEDAS